MARKNSLLLSPDSNNDDRQGDGREPEQSGDPSFNPDAFEQSATPAPCGPDPFDPEALRLSEDLNASMGVRKVLLSVPVKKPEKSWFCRVHPDPAYRLQTAVIELAAERGKETYLVDRRLWPPLAAEATFKP